MRIQLRDVSLAYGADAPILHGVNLVAEPGQFLVIQGPSGVGKSSLLRLLNRLQEPTTGDVLIDGRPVDDFDVTALRRRIGYVQQTPAMVDGTVLDNLRLPFRFRAASGSKPPTDDELESLMADFLLDDVRPSDDATRLSVGEKQRVALIRSLLTEPQVILCDEPTSALDPKSADVVERTLVRWHVDRQATIFLVTHLDATLEGIEPRHFTLARDDGLQEVST